VPDLIVRGGVVAVKGLAQEKFRLFRGRWLEDDLAVAALVGDDEVGVGLEVAAATAGVLE
jgi:hypothetical protein